MLNGDTEGGLDRRCYYEDGDSEDLSLSQLQNLALIDTEVTKKYANVSAAAGAKDVFDFEDDGQRTVLHCGVGHEESKTNVKDMLERTTMNAEQIVSKKKDRCDSFASFGSGVDDANSQVIKLNSSFSFCDSRNHQYIPHHTISHNNNNHRHGIESARITFSKTEGASKYAASLDGTLGEAREVGLRKSHRHPKPLRRVGESYNYEHDKLYYNRKKRAFEDAHPDIPTASHYDIPVDKAASSTLLSSPSVQSRSNEKNGVDNPEDNDGDWLERVAASLGADSSSLRRKRFAHSTQKEFPASSHKHASETATPSRNRAGAPYNLSASSSYSSNSCIIDRFLGRNDDNSQKSCASQYSLPLLSECPVRSWYGCLVFHKNDGRRRVGEVIIEQDKKWVEVVMDGALKKYHVKHLIVVPSDKFKVGDMVPSDFGAPSQSGTKGEVCANQLIFWLCEKCDACNDGRHLACLTCGTMKPASPERSIFLGVAREAMIMKDSHYSRRESVRLDMLDQPLSKTQIGMHSNQISQGKIAEISEVLPKFLRKLHQSQVNEVNWAIKNIEDSVLCGERTPFPLGMIYRKFFPGYGFHDGRIIKVVRKLFVDNDRNEKRPVLVYRCK